MGYFTTWQLSTQNGITEAWSWDEAGIDPPRARRNCYLSTSKDQHLHIPQQSREQGDQDGLQGDVPHIFVLACVYDTELSCPYWETAVTDGQKKMNIIHTWQKGKELNTTFTENYSIWEKGNWDLCHQELLKYTALCGSTSIVRKENKLASV